MSNLARTLALAALASSLAAAVPAHAEPELREHRQGGVSTGPASGPVGVVTYRRRPGPRFMMPLKIDLGAAGADTSRGFATGAAGAIGIHWASLSPKPTNFDVGVGLFGAILAAPKDATGMQMDDGAAYGGAYLELAQTLSHGSFWRTWASGRGEYLGSAAFGNSHTGLGASGRLSAELFLSGAGVEPRGVFVGTYAVGLYVEAGARDTVADLGRLHVSAGLTLRTPLVFMP